MLLQFLFLINTLQSPYPETSKHPNPDTLNPLDLAMSLLVLIPKPKTLNRFAGKLKIDSGDQLPTCVGFSGLGDKCLGITIHHLSGLPGRFRFGF